MSVFQELYQFFKVALQPTYSQREIEQMWRALKEDVLLRKPSNILPTKENVDPEALIGKMVSALKKGCPIQYVTGVSYFMGIRMVSDHRALIPRPETEELTHWAITDIKKTSDGILRILDIGTGSGCIAIALKKRFPKMDVFGIDISQNALSLARENATLLRLDVTFKKLDILDYEKNELNDKKWDIILSNPPYIPYRESHKIGTSVLEYEPHQALFVEDHSPLIFYQTIYGYAQQHLNSGGRIYLECNEFNAKEVHQLFNTTSFTSVQLRADMQGKPRMICAIK